MKIALVFPGYGSQFVGMGKELYDEYRIVQEYFEEASSCLDINFVKLCFASSEIELRKMQHAYPAIFLLSSSIAALLQDIGVKADVMAGYNQGEYAAIFAGKGISLPDGLYLLSKYASFYQEALEALDVAAIHISNIETRDLEKICKQESTLEQKAAIAIYESKTEHVVTGDKLAVTAVRDKASKFAEKTTINIEPVGVEVGLHSALMDPVVEQFKIYLEKVDFKDLLVPLIETVEGKKIEQGNHIREQIVKRINSPVLWTQVMHALEPYDVVVQAGPGTLLRDLVQQTYPDKTVVAVNTKEDIEALKQVVGMQEQTQDEAAEHKKQDQDDHVNQENETNQE